MKKRSIWLATSLMALSLFTSCSSNDATTTSPQSIVNAISTAVRAAGSGMATGRANRPTTSSCDVHGYPNGISQSDPNYPGYLTYCFMSVEAGDTVLGGFEIPATLGCVVANSGITFSGSPQTITVTQSLIDTCGLNDMGRDDQIAVGTEMTFTGSAPASFNSNYAYGVVLDAQSSLGLTFKIAYNPTGDKVSFITHESWTDESIGTTGGSFDSSTGELWYESRVERENCDTSGRCGWNRHTRIKATLAMSGGEPTDLSSISFGYSNIQFPPGQSGLGGVMVTAKGNLTDGIKARLWEATDGSSGIPAAASDYNVVGNWEEVSNSKCYTSSSEVALTCGSGLAGFSTNTKFLLHSTDGHTSTENWLTSITGQTFTDVNMDSDTQF